MTLRQSTTSLFVLAATLACGGDSNGPSDDGLDFPNFSSTLRSEFCIRGNTTSGETESGNIGGSDCDDGESYFETWVVMVESGGPVTFEVSSNFDSWLTLVRVDSYTSTEAEVTILDEDDDSAGGVDARLTYTLQPGVIYVIGVAGYDYGETGSYTLHIDD